jgi:hypothetical protein
VSRLREVEPLLQGIRALVLELEQLEGDGADGATLASRRRELDDLRSHLAALVSHDPALVAA